MKTIIIHEGQKNTIQGECKPREAMEILGLEPKEWKVTSKEVTGKAITFTIDRVRSLALVPVANPCDVSEPKSALTVIKPVTELVAVDEKPKIPPAEINVYREELLAVLQVACDVISKKSLMPVLGMVKIEVNAETLTVTATDLELSYTASIPAITNAETSFLTDAMIFYMEVKALSQKIDDVIIKVDADSIQINNRCTLVALTTEDFPEIESVNGREAHILNLKHALACVLPAVSVDEARYILTGVCFDLSAGVLVATDGFRLHRMAVDRSDIAPFVVPKRAASLLHKYGAESVIVSEKKLSSPLVGGIFVSRLIEGNYPNHTDIWPDVEKYNKVHFKAVDFLDLLPGVLPVSENSTIEMTINGRIDIEAHNSNGSYKWHVPAESSLNNGEPKELTINCRYIVDAIRAYADAKTIDIAFPSDYGAIVVNEQALIMPIRK